MDKISLKINGKQITAIPDQTILDVVRDQGLDEIPTLCHLKGQEPYGSCFVCVVEVKGRRTLVPSCATKVAPDMEVITNNQRVYNARKSALELLLSNHYADCVGPCISACPTHVDAQGYIALAAMGLYKEGIELIRKTNPFPSVCARVCVRFCEQDCRRQIIDESVGINNIKRYLTDVPGVFDDLPPRPASTGKKIAMVGAGPSGLTAAYYLGLSGHSVEIFESSPKPGGMLRYGIPEYRLPKDILDKEIDFIVRASGAVIKTSTIIGKDISLNDLKKSYDAVYIAAGAAVSNSMRVKGEFDTKGVIGGIEFLRQNTDSHQKLKGTAVIIGGGNTAMDAARVSWRLGADKVIILYRRTIAEMPADSFEIEACKEEEIEIKELAAPIEIIKKDDGSLKALKCIQMKLGEPDSSGRRRPVPIEGSEFELPCDLAIAAIGQKPILDGIIEADKKITQTKWNSIVINTKTMETNVEGIFAGGDVADDGPTVVIDAIRDGKIAALSINKYLNEDNKPMINFKVRKNDFGDVGLKEIEGAKFPKSPRLNMPEIPVKERRLSFKEVATGYSDEQLQHETERCLSCGCVVADTCNLRKYADDYDIDVNHFHGKVAKQKIDDRHPNIIYDPNKCILCTKCSRTCNLLLGNSALGLINRGINTEMRPAMDDELSKTNCVSCGNCVDVCPTGALTVKLPYHGRSSLNVKTDYTSCAFCSLTCSIAVKSYGKGRYYITSPDDPGLYICQTGRFGYEQYIDPNNRIMEPKIKNSAANWELVYKDIANNLTSLSKTHGPDSIGIFVSPDLTDEELKILYTISKDKLKTSNFDSLSLLNLKELKNIEPSDRSVLNTSDIIISSGLNLKKDFLILNADVLKAVAKGAKFYGSLDKLINVKAKDLYKELLLKIGHDSKVSIIINPLCEDNKSYDENKLLYELSQKLIQDKIKVSYLTPTKFSNYMGLQKYGLSSNIKKLKAALIVGEGGTKDLLPKDLKYLAIIDTLKTPFSQKASATLPLPWFLEKTGTRINFEGKKVSYTAAQLPPFNKKDIIENLIKYFA